MPFEIFFFKSGLAAAYKLKSKGLNVTVFEADGRVGGKLRSVVHNGLIWDEGANTMVVVFLIFFKFNSHTSVLPQWLDE